MPVDKDYQIRRLESLERVPPEEERDGATTSDLHPSPQVALEALRATAGADEVFKQIPSIENFDLWVFIAYFSVCSKSGTARYLDLWDTDHFDGFTDMQKCLNDCRAWFSADGYTTWGSGETRTGRVNCYFTAPSNGDYVCTAGLQSYPTGSPAQVECLIDNSSFGPLPFTGTIFQSHPATLSAGGHHFRIRQRSGSFFFLSLTVWRV
jgi:hypothetical protein